MTTPNLNNINELSISDKLKLPENKDVAIEFFSKLSQQEVLNLKYDFLFNARPKQIMPPKNNGYVHHVLVCGRGFGKSFAGAGWVKSKAEEAIAKGKPISIGLIGDTYTDVLKYQIKPILDMYPPRSAPKYNTTHQKLVWTKDVEAHVLQAETPDKIRGANLTAVWIDEFAKFMYYQEVWDQIMFAMRVGNIQTMITTTPHIRANKLLKKIINGDYGKAYLVTGSSYENTKLNDTFFKNLKDNYENTRLGQQEINGVLLEDNVGALWTYEYIKRYKDLPNVIEYNKDNKIKSIKPIEEYINEKIEHIVVSVDPAVTSNENSNETGIIVAGKDSEGKGYVLEDKSGKYSPLDWAKKAIDLYYKYNARCIVVEKNQGGDLVSSNIYNVDRKVKIEPVHASKGKLTRAEPIAALYEQGLIYHVAHSSDKFKVLEEQMTTYTGRTEKSSNSPDRLDALVWAFSYLFSDRLKKPVRGHTNIDFGF